MDSDVLTLQEIEKKYPDQWVILDRVKADPGPVLRGGRVIFSCRETEDAYRQLESLPKGGGYAIHYFGYPPDDVAFAL